MAKDILATRSKIAQKNKEEIFEQNDKYKIGLVKEELNPFTVQCFHWHQDFEFIICMKGTYDVEFGNKMHHIKEGDGVFINSCVLHNPKPRKCKYIVALINPILLFIDTDVFSTFVAPLIGVEDFPGLELHANDPKQKKIITKIIQMNEYIEENNPSLPLFIQSSIFEIWQYFYENVSTKGNYIFESEQMTCIKSMMDYVRLNYENNIKITDIAKHVNVSERTCNNLFNKYIHMSPNNYVIEYRLTKAKELLEHSQLNMTEIAIRCGFHSSSYFAETFKMKFKLSPKDYRKNFILSGLL